MSDGLDLTITTTTAHRPPPNSSKVGGIVLSTPGTPEILQFKKRCENTGTIPIM